jgi:hypothetical protein
MWPLMRTDRGIQGRVLADQAFPCSNLNVKCHERRGVCHLPFYHVNARCHATLMGDIVRIRNVSHAAVSELQLGGQGSTLRCGGAWMRSTAMPAP